MFKIIVLSLMTVLSCQKTSDKKENEPTEKERAIESAIFFLRKLDTSNTYNLYYAIETKDSLLYVVNTNKDSRPTFTYFYGKVKYNNLDDHEYLTYLDIDSIDLEMPTNLISETTLPELNGVIFKISQEKDKPQKYIKIREGDILEEVSNDPDLIIEEIIREEPDW